MKRAVFIDRDGVINRGVVIDGRPHPPPSLDQLELLPGVPEALDTLRRAGFLRIVVTNQPDVATGKQRREVVEAMHQALRARLPLDDIYACYHTDAHQCDCRKPRPGMLLEAARAWSVDLPGSFMVGDRWRDVEAGKRAGCRTLWVNAEDYSEPAPQSPHWVVRSLLEASEIICRQNVARGKETE
jgi:D-glycero-D-manno-heptose 1,7-bisphosphate phosphatase